MKMAFRLVRSFSASARTFLARSGDSLIENISVAEFGLTGTIEAPPCVSVTRERRFGSSDTAERKIEPMTEYGIVSGQMEPRDADRWNKD